MISNEYMAGFMDGEGYIGICKQNTKRGTRHYVQINLTNTNLEIMQKVQAAFGGGKLTYKKQPTERHKGAFQLCWNGHQSRAFLEAIQPHLIVKSEQAKIVLELLDNVKPWSRYAETAELRAAAYRRVKALNQKGPANIDPAE